MDITKPTKTTYFICRNEAMEIKAYGIVEPNQVMITSQPNVKTYTRKGSWKNKLLSENIDISGYI